MRKLICSTILNLSVVFYVLLIYRINDSTSESNSKLEEIRIAVTQNEERIAELKNSMSLLQGDLKKLNNSIKIITERESKLKKELNKVQNSKIQVETIINDLKGRLVEVELRAMARIRALYTTPRATIFKVVNGNNQRVSRAVKYAAILREHDRLDLLKIHELRGLQATENTKLDQLSQQQSTLLAESSLQRADLENRRKSVEKIVSEFNQKKKSVEKEVLGLRSQELRLEAVLKGITGGEQAIIEGKDEVRKSKASNKDNTVFSGEGFPKGKLTVLSGEIIEKFGKSISGGGTSKGIVISTKQPILKSALPSKVSFVGKMPRIGTVVILDHGNRDYTLMGKLKASLVKQGDVIEADQALAEVDISENGVGQVYLETRRAGKPINPITIYKTS